MSDVKLAYGSSSALTITLASLASDISLIGGRQATVIDATGGLIDILLSGKIKTGTSPTTARQIEVHAIAPLDDSNWPDAFGASDAAVTISSVEVKGVICNPVAIMPITSTTGAVYSFSGVSLAALFGGTLPPKIVIWVVHNCAVALDSTGGNHALYMKPVYATVS